MQLALQFPTAPFSNAVFTMYLHKYIFWYQVKVAEVNLFPAFLATVQKRARKEPTLSFEEYINKSRQRN